jgi:formate C-acetyltransferase
LFQLVELTEVQIRPEWSLAGEHMTGQALADPDAPHLSDQLGRLAEYGLDAEDAAALKTTMLRWHTVTRGAFSGVGSARFDCAPEERSEFGHTVYMARGWMENHSIRDYPKLLRIGYGGLLAEIERERDTLGLDSPALAEREAFWRAAATVCRAGMRLGERYAEAAAALAARADSADERDRLLHMRDACRRVPAQGARTLREAVQALWFGHILTCGEDGINANSIGRLDQMLQPYFEADMESGRIDRDGAVLLMAELACKLYQDYDVQAITLAGRDAYGKDLANDMTWVILEASERVGFVRDLSVRLHRHSPRKLYRQCARMIREGGGIPFLFNDECFLPALVSHGVDASDAGDYAPIGCVELTIPGKANPHAVSGWFNGAKCLELALFGGMDPRTGMQLGPATGDLTSCADFADLWQAYTAQVSHFARRMVYFCNRGELMQREGGPLPCWSLLTDDCIPRGRDITDGGCLYNYHSICFLGTANVADSLCAIRRLVFEQGRVPAQDLLEALRANFDGTEELRQLLLNGAPKYGNDNEEVDELAVRVSNHFIDLMDAARSPLEGRYVVHLFSFLLNIGFGQGLGATPDGRRAGEPVAYSLSAQQGRDQEGVTAFLRSLSKLPHARAAGASAAILDVEPKMVEGNAGLERLADILETAVGMGVGQLQVNVTTAERLRKAQADPERFGNIPVRVAGYSQLFRLLDRDLQNHVIARTKHSR